MQKKARTSTQLLLVLILVVSQTTLHSQVWSETIKLTASDASYLDNFGSSVAISDNRAIVGTPYNSDDAFGSGSAYIFEKVDGVWIEMVKLTASDAQFEGYFGLSVSISGTVAIVGAIGNGDEAVGGASGAAYIFELVDGAWVEVIKLTASDADFNDRFGGGVSVSETTAIVGAGSNDDDGASSGSAYIFEKVDGAWTEVIKLTASDAVEGDRFGGRVSISGTRAIIGTPLNDDVGTSSGAVYIFEVIDGVWTEVVKLGASDADTGDLFGTKVSISGTRVIVGAIFNSDDGEDSGSAYIFELIDGVWTEVVKLTASDGTIGDRFGSSVSISGTRVIVGAHRNDDDGISSGSAYVFELIDGVWTEVIKLTASDANEDDFFGISSAISGGNVIVGAHENDDDGTDSGSAYIFEGCPDLDLIATVDRSSICLGDSVIFTATGADDFTWDMGVIDGIPYEPLTVGITAHTVSVVIDSTGCEYTSSVDLTVIDEIIVTYTTADELFGGDGEIDITVTGGTPIYTFDWDNDETGDFDDEEDLSDLTGGTFIIVVEDEGGCSATETVTVNSQLGISELIDVRLSVYPNPTTDNITIEFDGFFNYELASISGTILQKGQATDEKTIALHELVDGVYFITIEASELLETLKVIKK